MLLHYLAQGLQAVVRAAPVVSHDGDAVLLYIEQIRSRDRLCPGLYGLSGMEVEFQPEGLLVPADEEIHIVDKCLLPVDDAHASGDIHRPFLQSEAVGSGIDYRCGRLSPCSPEGGREQERDQQQCDFSETIHILYFILLSYIGIRERG